MAASCRQFGPERTQIASSCGGAASLAQMLQLIAQLGGFFVAFFGDGGLQGLREFLFARGGFGGGDGFVQFAERAELGHLLGGFGVFVESAEGFHAVFEGECGSALFAITCQECGERAMLHHDDVGSELFEGWAFVLGAVVGEKIEKSEVADSVADDAIVVIEGGECDVAMGVLQAFFPQGLTIFDADGEGRDIFGGIGSGGGIKARLVIFEEGREAVRSETVGAAIEEHLKEAQIKADLETG